MKQPRSARLRALAALPLLAALASPVTAATLIAAPARAAATTSVDDLPDPTARGSYTPRTIQEVKLGTTPLNEPDSAGGAPTAGSVAAPEDMEIRGALYHPDFTQRTEPSPLIVLVHGNHGSCDGNTNSAGLTCVTAFKRNEAGYAYLGENLASWGYTVFSLSQDQLMMRQDNAKGKGMHQRRLLIAATLDALSAGSSTGLVNDAHTTLGDTLKGKLDMTRIGLMGHSRGGDAVTSFIDYNRIRTDGPRYPLRGVISLAPVDYERKAPYGTPYMTILPMCDGDVSNLQGARFFERSQYVNGDDPFPRIQVTHLGSIHNWYNTVWYADGGADGQNNNDAACGNSTPFSTTAATNVHPNNLRLSGAASYTDDAQNYKIDNSDTFNPLVNTKISGDPARMGDQEKLGLATMAAFFRRYVGGEGAFEPYLTGELSDTDSHLQIPASACPTSVSGTRIGCEEYASTTYFAPPAQRVDVIRPEIENPLSLNALGGTLSGSGFAYPYLDNGAVALPKRTAGGYDWCNPEPDDFAPAQLGKPTQPTGAKACPLPGKAALGGQNGIRENAPVNHSYGRQLALAWESGRTAELTAQIPAASQDMSGLEALVVDADVNFFDLRNPGADNRGDNTRTGTSPNWEYPNEKPTAYDPASTTQDFVIALRDEAGHEATVHAGDERWGNALHMSTGTNTPNTHIVLEQIRVPLSEFAAQGVDLGTLDAVELRFGEDGTPASGSIQLADLRFQESTSASDMVLSDGDVADGAGSGAPATGPDPATFLTSSDNTPGNVKLDDQVGHEYNDTAWVVDDDRAQCPTASFTSIQDAVDFAAPWDTIVVCEGTYQESSTPFTHAANPVAAGATNGLTITKPLKIKGAGAGKVTIEPDQSLRTLAGAAPYLRDGGGNVITVSRQSLGSTDTNEMFVDISGVTVTSGSTWAEAGIAFFGAAGRVSESVVGPMKVATSAAELAENPHGWGIVKTGLIRGSGAGTVENEVTVANSVVTGYQSGGILFDGARGRDGAADNVVRTGIEQHGYVSSTVVKGTPNSVYPQTGVKFTSGADGFVKGSRVTGNYFKADPAKSYGILATDAGTGTLSVSGSILTGNGFAAYNANADNTAVRVGAPLAVSGSYVGSTAPVAGGPADPSTGVEAISGTDVNGAASITLTTRATTAVAGVPTTVGAVADNAPTAAVVDPGNGTKIDVGETVYPLLRGSDDFAVKSATLLVDGSPVGTATTAPYLFGWTPSATYAGKEVRLQAAVTDSSGRTTTSEALTLVVAEEPEEPTTPPTTPPTTTPPVVPPVAPVTNLVVEVGKVKPNTRRGTAVLGVSVSAAGTLSVTGPKVRSVTRTASGATTLKAKVKVTGSKLKKLKKKGRVGVTLTIRFVSTTGATSVTTTRVVLVRKR